MPLTREQIRARAKSAIKTKDVPVPQFDGETIRLRQMTGGELIEWQGLSAKAETDGTEGELARLLIQRSAVDDAGAPLWPGPEGLEDIDALPGDVLTLLAGEAAKLNGVSEEAIAEEKNG